MKNIPDISPLIFYGLLQDSNHQYIYSNNYCLCKVYITMGILHMLILLNKILIYKIGKYLGYLLNKHCNYQKDNCKQHIKNLRICNLENISKKMDLVNRIEYWECSLHSMIHIFMAVPFCTESKGRRRLGHTFYPRISYIQADKISTPFFFILVSKCRILTDKVRIC